MLVPTRPPSLSPTAHAEAQSVRPAQTRGMRDGLGAPDVLHREPSVEGNLHPTEAPRPHPIPASTQLNSALKEREPKGVPRRPPGTPRRLIPPGSSGAGACFRRSCQATNNYRPHYTNKEIVAQNIEITCPR
ncbi:translation initiation factor IF-2-like [Choloepus didactylus]|uniref:translation initiation factor IF-2-like n=1 Tax=Choloepus didactylus TaxID=27675 RepID=UPI0018A0A3F7|nr:translation initiation factor IF-2-like [Choloepus didactylus]